MYSKNMEHTEMNQFFLGGGGGGKMVDTCKQAGQNWS